MAKFYLSIIAYFGFLYLVDAGSLEATKSAYGWILNCISGLVMLILFWKLGGEFGKLRICYWLASQPIIGKHEFYDEEPPFGLRRKFGLAVAILLWGAFTLLAFVLFGLTQVIWRS